MRGLKAARPFAAGLGVAGALALAGIFVFGRPSTSLVVPATAAQMAAAPQAAGIALDQLAFRLALLERRAEAAPPDGGMVSAALGLVALQEARRRLDAGQPFAAEIAALRRFQPALAGSDALDTAERHAAQGIETMEAIRRHFARLRPMLERQAAPPGGVGAWLGRGWQAVLETLALTDARPPVGAEALRAVDEALAAGDLGTAQAASERLQGEAAHMLDSWLPALRARLATERAFDTLQMESWRRMAAQ
jgi:hypothetical protein